MRDHLFIGPRRIVIERDLTAYPPDIRQQYRGDPAHWLPGRLTMHGASAFHTRTRFLGARVRLEYMIGPPWTRGDATTRSMRIQVLDPPLGMAWLLPVVGGELTILRGGPSSRLRFEGRSVVSGLLGMRTWSATWLVRRVTDGVTARLSTQAPPVPPSKASPAR